MDKRINLQSLLVVAASLAIFGEAFASDFPSISAAGHSSPEQYPGLTLAWREEFGGNAMDPKSWVRGSGHARVQKGYLVISAHAQASGGRHFTSSIITTRGKREFRFGRIDIRALLPGGPGLRSSLKLLADSVARPVTGEIEVAEMSGGQGREGTVNGTLRWGQGREQHYEGGSFILPSGTFEDQFHVFSIEWDADSIRWLVDGHVFLEQDISAPAFDAFREDFYLQVELSMVGESTARTPLSGYLVLDYIRVFQ